MKNLFKNLFIVFIIFLIISGIFTIYSSSQTKLENISLSQLAEEIKQENVSKITVEGEILKIELIDGTEQKTRKESGIALTESLRNYGVDLTKVNIEIKELSGAAFWLGTILPFLLPFIIVIAFFWLIFRQAKKTNLQAMGFGRSLARIIKPEKGKKGNNKKGVTFKDVAGLKEAKEELQEVIEFLKNPKKFTQLGAKIPKGVLLVGAPGTGKTLLARAVANEADVPFFSISGSEFIEMFVGVGASRTRSLFREAKKNLPAIIFIDELDAIGRTRGVGLGGAHEEREQTLNQILVEMDGFEPNIGLVILSATNRPDVLDPALLRPGRFDRRIVLPLPDIKEREAILKIHSRGKPLAKTVKLKNIAERTPGFSGADLANLINEAAILTARKNKKQIGMSELRISIEKVLLGPERKSHVLSKKEKKITAYHEAGHALAAHFLPHCDPVQKVSIIARGEAAGYVLKTPIKDKRLHSKKEFLDELAVFLSGYTAEKLIFDDITTGAANDLAQASDLARKLVTEYGMSEKLGPVRYGQEPQWALWGRELTEAQAYSEKIATEIDKEISKFIDKAQETAKKILEEKRNLLDKLAKELIKKETIEKKEFEKLMGR